MCDDDVSRIELVNDIVKELEWNELFTKLQNCAKLVEISRLVDPTIDLELERALKDILSKRSDRVQSEIKNLSMIHADLRPPELTDEEYERLNMNLKMEFAS